MVSELREIRSIIEKASDIESRAAYDYMFGLSRLRSMGYLKPELEESVKRIAVETIVHKHLVEGLLHALNELDKLDQGLSSIEERIESSKEIPEELRTLLRRFAERHLEIEKNMIAVYEELAEKARHPLIRKLAEGLSENERSHHKYLVDLIQSLK